MSNRKRTLRADDHDLIRDDTLWQRNSLYEAMCQYTGRKCSRARRTLMRAARVTTLQYHQYGRVGVRQRLPHLVERPMRNQFEVLERHLSNGRTGVDPVHHQNIHHRIGPTESKR